MNPGLIKAFVAAAAIAPHRIVAASAGGAVAPAAAATDALIGVSDLGGDAGRTVDLILSDTAPVEYGGPVAFGDMLTADAVGRAVVAAPAAGANVSIIGQAMAEGVLGDIGIVHIAKSKMQG